MTDPRLQFSNVGVPIIHVMSQSDYLLGITARRPDSVELGGSGCTKPVSRLALLRQLSATTTRVGWRWSEISAVEIDRMQGELIIDASSNGEWVHDGWFWRPSACASGLVDRVVGESLP